MIPENALRQLREQGELLIEELSREYYASMSGRKSSAELEPIYARHAAILDRDAIQWGVELLNQTSLEAAERRSVQIILEWLVEMQSGRALAAVEDRELTWQSSAVVQVAGGRRIPYHRVPIELANATDARERSEIDLARARLVDVEFVPLRRERFQRERAFVESLGIASSYNAAWELLSGISLEALEKDCRQCLAATQELWDTVSAEFVRNRLHMNPQDVTRADSLTLLRAREFDEYFPATAMNSVMRRQAHAMGLDPNGNGRITMDLEDREGKHARAFCAPVKIPNEIYLVVKPHGGQTDWVAFLHELGHAQHYAHMSPELPMEYRYTGDNSITEGIAALFDHLVQEPEWLKEHTDLPTGHITSFVRSAAFDELHFLRRFCAKLLYEVQLYGNPSAWETLPELYAELLTRATSYRYSPAYAFIDVDPRYYAARYLRARQLQAVIRETLLEQFGAAWWNQTASGEWMIEELFARGQGERAQELAARVAGRDLDFTSLIQRLHRQLA